MTNLRRSGSASVGAHFQLGAADFGEDGELQSDNSDEEQASEILKHGWTLLICAVNFVTCVTKEDKPEAIPYPHFSCSLRSSAKNGLTTFPRLLFVIPLWTLGGSRWVSCSFCREGRSWRWSQESASSSTPAPPGTSTAAFLKARCMESPRARTATSGSPRRRDSSVSTDPTSSRTTGAHTRRSSATSP